MDKKASISNIAPLAEDSIPELTHAFDDISSATLSTISQLSNRCNVLLDSLRAIHLNTLCSHIEKELSSALSLPSLDELKLDTNFKSSIRNNSVALIANGCVQSQIVNVALTSPKSVKSDESPHLVNGSSQLVKNESPSLFVKEEHLNSQSLSPSRLPPRVIAQLQRPEIAQFLDHSIALLEQVLKPSESQVISDATDANPKPQVVLTTNDNTVSANSSDPVVNAPADSVVISAVPLPVSHEHRKDKHKHKRKHKHRQVNGERPESADKHKHRKHKHKSRDESRQEASQTHTSPTHESKQDSPSASAHKHSKHKRKHERHRESAPDGSSTVPDGVALVPPASHTADGGELVRDAATGDGDADGSGEPLSQAAQTPTEDSSANSKPVATFASLIPDVWEGAPQKPKRPRPLHETKTRLKRPVDGAVPTSTTQDSEALPVSVPLSLPKASKKSKAKKTKTPKSNASACASDLHLFTDATDGSISPGAKPTLFSGESTTGKLVLKLKLSRLSVSDAGPLSADAGAGTESSTAAASAADPTSAPPFAKPRAPLPSTSSAGAGSKKHTRWSLPPPLLPSDAPLHAEASDEEADSVSGAGAPPSSSSKLPSGRPKRLRMPSTQHKASEYELQPPFARPRRAPFGIQSPSDGSKAAGGSKAKCTSTASVSVSVSCSSTRALCSPSASANDSSVCEQLSTPPCVTPSAISKMVSGSRAHADAAALRTPPEKKRSRARFFSSNNNSVPVRAHEAELPAKKARTLSYGAEQMVGEAEADVDADADALAGGRCAFSSSCAAALVNVNGECECEQSAAGDELSSASATAKKEPIPTPGWRIKPVLASESQGEHEAIHPEDEEEEEEEVEEELDDEAFARLHEEAERESMARYTALINEMRSNSGKCAQYSSSASARTRSVSLSASKPAKPAALEARQAPTPGSALSSVPERPEATDAPQQSEHTRRASTDQSSNNRDREAAAPNLSHQQSPTAKEVNEMETETTHSTPTHAASSDCPALRDSCEGRNDVTKDASKDAPKDVSEAKPPDAKTVAKQCKARGKMVRTLEYVLADEPGFELRQFPLAPAGLERMRDEDEDALALAAEARNRRLLSIAVPFPWLLECDEGAAADRQPSAMSTRELLTRTLSDEEQNSRLLKYLESRRKLVASRSESSKQRKRTSLSTSASATPTILSSASVYLQTSCSGLRLQPGSLEPLTPTKRGRGRPPGPKSYSKHSDLLSKIKKAATRLAVVPASVKLLSKSPSPRAPSRLKSNSPPRGPRVHALAQALTAGGLEARNAGDAQSRQAEEQRSLFAFTKRSPLRTASRTSSASSRSPGLVINSAEGGESAPLSGSVADSASTAPSTPAPDLFAALPPPPPLPQPQNTLFRKAAPVAIGGQFLSPGTFIVTSTHHPGPRMRFPVVSATASALSLTSSPAALHPLPTAICLQRGPITAIVTPTTIFTPLPVRGVLPMPMPMPMHAVQNVGGSVQTVQLAPPNMLPVLHVRSPTPLPVICTISPPRAPTLNMQSPATMQMQMQSGMPFSLSSAPTPLNLNLTLTQAQAPMLPLSLSSAPAPTPQFSVISANPISLVPIQFTTNARVAVQRPPTTFLTAASSFFPTPLTAAPSLASVAAAAAPTATPTVAHPPAASAGAGVGDRSFSSELSALFSNVVAGIGLPTSSTGAVGALGAAPRNSATVSVAAAQSSAAPAAAPLEIDLSLPISFTSLSAPAGAQQTQQR